MTEILEALASEWLQGCISDMGRCLKVQKKKPSKKDCCECNKRIKHGSRFGGGD
jgi:hypothetical protein